MPHAKFHVGDHVRVKSKYSPACTVVATRGVKWVKLTGHHQKAWWTSDQILFYDEWCDWVEQVAQIKPKVMTDPDALPKVEDSVQAITTSMQQFGAALSASMTPVVSEMANLAASVESLFANNALGQTEAHLELVKKLSAATGMSLPDANLAVSKLKTLYAPPTVVPPTPTTAQPVAVAKEQPQELVETVTWVPVVPGTLKLGDTVSYPPHKQFQHTEKGVYTATVVSLSGKAWVKLAAKPQWHPASTLFRRKTTKTVAGFAAPTGWAPAPADWVAWRKYWTPWFAALTEQERHALLNYCGSGYVHINSILRTATHHGVHASTIQRLDTALSKGLVPFDLEVFRSGSKKFDTATPIGSVITDLGFISTSTNESFARGWHNPGVFMTIRVPKGSRGAYVQLQSQHKHEYELLLPRGSQLRLIELTHTPGQRAEAILELL